VGYFYYQITYKSLFYFRLPNQFQYAKFAVKVSEGLPVTCKRTRKHEFSVRYATDITKRKNI
jgi:hypothetical protein